MKWHNLSTFTWEELKYFTWEDLKMDTSSFALKYTNHAINLPKPLHDKILKICSEQFEIYAKILGVKIEKPSRLSKIADILSVLGFLFTLQQNPKVADAVQSLADLLIALLNNQIMQILGK